jgi:hypothetical protein
VSKKPIKVWRYSLPSEDGFGGWGVFFLDSAGVFAAVTDYGNASYVWRGHGERDFREFVAGLARDPHYTLGKLAQPTFEWPMDVEATRKACRSAVLDARRQRARQWDRDRARIEWDALQRAEDEHELLTWIREAPLDDRGDLIARRPPAGMSALIEKLLPRLAAVIRAELAAEALPKWAHVGGGTIAAPLPDGRRLYAWPHLPGDRCEWGIEESVPASQDGGPARWRCVVQGSAPDLAAGQKCAEEAAGVVRPDSPAVQAPPAPVSP